jgi:hypothetical protein
VGICLWVVAACLWAAVAAPVTYESRAVVEIGADGAKPGRPVPVEQRLRDALCEAPCGAVSIRQMGGGRWTISVLARTPGRAQRDASALVHQRLVPPPLVMADVDGALDRAAEHVAAFLAKHPDVALSSAPPPAVSSGAARVLSASATLGHERARLEAELARAKEAEHRPAGDNPYDDPKPAAGIAYLERRLAEVKAAIARGRDDPPTPAAASGSDGALQTEWHSLVGDLVDAQASRSKPAPVPAPSLLPGLTVRLVEDATLPVAPVPSPRMLLLASAGPLGLLLGALWALVRAGVAVSSRPVFLEPTVEQASVMHPTVELLVVARGDDLDVIGTMTRVAHVKPDAEDRLLLAPSADLDAAEREAGRLLDVARADGAQGAAADAWQMLATVRQRRGEIIDALVAWRSAAQAARAAGLEQRECALHVTLGSALATLGARAEARTALLEGLRIAHRIGDPRVERGARMHLLAWTATFGSDEALDAELADVRAHADAAARGGWIATDSTALGILFHRACELVAFGDRRAVDTAAALLQTTVSVGRSTSNRSFLAAALAMSARTELARGGPVRATALVEQARDLVEPDAPWPSDPTGVYLALHDVRVATGDESEAREAVTAGLSVLSRTLRSIAGAPYARSFLSELPHSVQLLALARRYGILPAELEGGP